MCSIIFLPKVSSAGQTTISLRTAQRLLLNTGKNRIIRRHASMSLMQTSRTWGNKGTKIVELEGRANEISEVDSVHQ
jgi:hypothetical protein